MLYNAYVAREQELRPVVMEQAQDLKIKMEVAEQENRPGNRNYRQCRTLERKIKNNCKDHSVYVCSHKNMDIR